MLWNNLSSIRRTVSFHVGNTISCFARNIRGWIWKSIPRTSIWPIPNQHQGQRSHKSRGHGTPRIKWHGNHDMAHLWIITNISFKMFLHTTVPSFFVSLQGGGWGGCGGLGRVCSRPAQWICHTAVSTSQRDKIPLVEKCNFEFERGEAWIRALTWTNIHAGIYH